jgi:CDP-diacylglycerol--glycerol-3-phosphate 3-phosphatidyltransferase
MKVKGPIFTIPNVLSLFRLGLLIPILICLSREKRFWALFFMLVGVGTDFLDGYIARRWNQSSDLGRLMDPVIDKVNVLIVTCYLVLSPIYHFPLWFFGFILIRELTLMICSGLVVRKHTGVMESNRPGKNSAFATGMTVVMYVLGYQPYAAIVLWIAFVLTVYSSWVYFRLFVQRIKPKSN